MRSILTSLIITFYSTCFSQQITDSQKDSLIIELKKLVLEKYVITDKAQLIFDSLNAQKYSKLDQVDSVVKQLNRDLFRFSKDKHLGLQYDPKMALKLLSHLDTHAEQEAKEQKENYGFAERKVLEGNIGYLKLNYFADAKNAENKVFSYFYTFRNTKALILDLRGNTGGNGSMVQLLASIFLPDEQTELLKITYKNGDVVTLKTKKIDPRFQYIQKPLYLLCDSKTFSAAEAFVFILYNKNRAITIGKTTAGAGNISGPYPIGSKFVITIPVGTIVDPVSQRGWEQKGVTPDHYIDPEKALDKALELINTTK